MGKILSCFGFFLTALISYSQNPEFKWAKRIGDEYAIYCGTRAITNDDSNNVYTVGYFHGTIDFNPDSGVYKLSAKKSANAFMANGFITKTDSSGKFLWARNIGDTSYALSIVTDADGNSYTTGYFFGTTDFDPGIKTHYLSTSYTGSDAFILKLDAEGNFVWAKQIKGLGQAEPNAIVLDPSGNGSLLITGEFETEADFDLGPGEHKIKAVGGQYDWDAFILKLDTAGNFIWAKTIGNNYDQEGYSITIDKHGNIYTSGIFSGTVDFDPDSIANYYLSSPLNANTTYSAFVLKLDSNGYFLWAKKISGTGDAGIECIKSDKNGNTYSIGSFDGTCDFDPGNDSFKLSPSGEMGTFILKLNSKGNFVWAKKTNRFWSYVATIALDESNHLYAAGAFSETCDFDLDTTKVFNLTSNAKFDAFISKMDTLGNLLWARNFGGSFDDLTYGIAVDRSENIYTTGNFRGVTDFNPGADTFNLTPVTNINAENIFTLKMGKGACTESNAKIDRKACDNYTSPSGKFTWTKSDKYIDIIHNYKGCDSVISVNLTIDTIDISITKSRDTLIAFEKGGTYQWIDCDKDKKPITGETGQVFKPKVNGNYAVIINSGTCMDTSACININTIGIKNIGIDGFTLYPNPSNGIFYVILSNPIPNAVIEVYNTIGILVHQQVYIVAKNCIDLSNQANGLYIVRIVSAGGLITTQKIIKE